MTTGHEIIDKQAVDDMKTAPSEGGAKLKPNGHDGQVGSWNEDLRRIC